MSSVAPRAGKSIGTIWFFGNGSKYDLTITNTEKNTISHHRTTSMTDLMETARQISNEHGPLMWDASIVKISPQLQLNSKTVESTDAKINIAFSHFAEFYLPYIPRSDSYTVKVNKKTIEVDFSTKSKDSLQAMRYFLEKINAIFSDNIVPKLLKENGDTRFLIISKSFKQKDLEKPKPQSPIGFTAKSPSNGPNIDLEDSSTPTPASSRNPSPNRFPQSHSAPILGRKKDLEEKKE